MRFLRNAAYAAVLLLAHPALADTDLSAFSGSWRGTTYAKVGDGKQEWLSCSSLNSARDSSTMNFTVRCANASTLAAHVRATVKQIGKNVSGTWEDRVHGAQGTLSGSIGSNSLHAGFEGGGAKGTINMAVSGGSLTVSISLDGEKFFSVALHR